MKEKISLLSLFTYSLVRGEMKGELQVGTMWLDYDVDLVAAVNHSLQFHKSIIDKHLNSMELVTLAFPNGGASIALDSVITFKMLDDSMHTIDKGDIENPIGVWPLYAAGIDATSMRHMQMECKFPASMHQWLHDHLTLKDGKLVDATGIVTEMVGFMIDRKAILDNMMLTKLSS